VYAAEVPKGSTYQLIAAWLLLAEGGVGLVFLPIIVLSTKTNIDPAEIAAFAIGCALSLGAGALLYSKWAWSWWLALAVSVAVPAWLFATGGLTSEKEGYIATGVVWTIGLAAAAIILAVILALFGALGRLSKNPVAYGITGFYTSFFRGTPLIVQLFLIYLALPQIGQSFERLSVVNILSLTTFQAGVLGLGLNYGAYMTEIFRAGIQSVGHGQAEAADALGMSYAQRMRRVVLPQATRVIIPPTGNEFIAMMKDTALVSFLGVELSRAELFRRAQLAASENVTERLEAFLVAAGMYWLLTAIFTYFQRRLERRMGKGYERGTQAAQRKPHFIQATPSGAFGSGAGVVDLPEIQAQPGMPVEPPP